MYEGKRKLASISFISEITPIEGADKIEVAHIRGWKVVVGKNEFCTGQKVVYFEIDSFLPVQERYEFLRSRCYKAFKTNGKITREGFRIKTCKLRGVISQGLVMPVTAFPEIPDDKLDGDDVTALLGVDHYDDVSAPFMPSPVQCGEKKSDFPSWIQKTDEERIQSIDDPFGTCHGKTFEVTIKRDGSSLTAFYAPSYCPEDPFGVCSRNMALKRPDSDSQSKYWNVILQNGYDKAISKYCADNGVELAFQGELVGPGVNGNRSLFKDFEWHVFRIFDIGNQCFVECSERRRICESIGLPHVPVVDESLDVDAKFSTVDEIVAFADGLDDRGNMREGLVFKENGTSRPFTFKAVSNKYLVQTK